MNPGLFFPPKWVRTNLAVFYLWDAILNVGFNFFKKPSGQVK